MTRTIGPILTLVLLSVSATACAPAPAGPPPEFDFGDWWGGFGHMEGDRLHWNLLQMTLRPEGDGIAGEGAYLTGPEQRGLADPSIEIEGRFRGAELRLTLDYGGRKVHCTGAYEAASVDGTCRIDGDTQTLRMVRVASLDPEEVAAVQAVYELDDERRILIGQVGPVPMMLHIPDGTTRMLYPMGAGRWSAGPRLIVAYPRQWSLEFSDDTLKIQRQGEAVQTATRRPVPQQEPFMFESRHDGITLHGTLTLPPGPGPHPGVVWVHGSGKTPRHESMFFPRYLADLGFALLSFDKRGVGESEGRYAMPDGSTFTESFLRRRGADVASAMNALRKHPRIVDAPVGLIGVSQAGWVMPVAASQTDCSFTVSLAGGATPLSQEIYFSELTDELRSDASLMPIERALEKVRARTAEDHDWSDDFAAQRCPGLWLYGLNDRINPSRLAIEVLERVKAEHGKEFTIVSFPEGSHPLFESRLGGREERLVAERHVRGMFPTLEHWLEDHGFTPKAAGD